MSLSQIFEAENKISDALDTSGLGLVRLNAGERVRIAGERKHSTRR